MRSSLLVRSLCLRSPHQRCFSLGLTASLLVDAVDSHGAFDEEEVDPEELAELDAEAAGVVELGGATTGSSSSCCGSFSYLYFPLRLLVDILPVSS